MSYKLIPNNDFPKIGILSLENSGENLLRWYLEKIFEIKTSCNIRNYKNNLFNSNKNNINIENELKSEDSWAIYTNYPIKDKQPYYKTQLSNSNNNSLLSNYYQCEISLGILLIRNPIDLIMNKIITNFSDELKQKDESSSHQFDFEIVDDLIDDWKVFIQYWIESPIPIHIIRYEDLITEPSKILRNLVLFLLGVDSIDSTIIESKLIDILQTKKPIKEYYAYDVDMGEEGKNIFSNKSNILKIQQKFDDQLFESLQQFNYEESGSKWIVDYNVLSLKESLLFHLTFDSSTVNSCFQVLSINS